MKKILILSGLLCALAISATSFAAQPGFYLGAGAGWSKLDTQDGYNPSSEQTHKRGGLGGRVFAGYNFNEFLGVELGATRFAKSTYNLDSTMYNYSKTYKSDAADLIGKAYLPLGDFGFSVYALGGVAYVHQNFQATGSSYGHIVNDSTKITNKFRPKYGLGASYDMPEYHVTTSLEVSRIQGSGKIKSSQSAIANADMAAITVAYNF